VVGPGCGSWGGGGCTCVTHGVSYNSGQPQTHPQRPTKALPQILSYQQVPNTTVPDPWPRKHTLNPQEVRPCTARRQTPTQGTISMLHSLIATSVDTEAWGLRVVPWCPTCCAHGVPHMLHMAPTQRPHGTHVTPKTTRHPHGSFNNTPAHTRE
jgi:hypothetical protein